MAEKRLQRIASETVHEHKVYTIQVGYTTRGLFSRPGILAVTAATTPNTGVPAAATAGEEPSKGVPAAATAGEDLRRREPA